MIERDFKVVHRDEFFSVIGMGDIHPRPMEHHTLWENQKTREVVGKSLPGYKQPGDKKVWMLRNKP